MVAALCNWVSRFCDAFLSAVILLSCAIEPVLSSTSATRSRVLPQVEVDVALMAIWSKPRMCRKAVGIVALPSSTSLEPAVEEYCAVTVTFCTSGRL